MSNAVEWGPSRLKCDAENCDFSEEVADISAKLIGKPCPKCGTNLLTEVDYKATVALKAAVDLLNTFVGPVSNTYSPEPALVLINPHQNKITITLPASKPHQE